PDESDDVLRPPRGRRRARRGVPSHTPQLHRAAGAAGALAIELDASPRSAYVVAVSYPRVARTRRLSRSSLPEILARERVFTLSRAQSRRREVYEIAESVGSCRF